jgi:methylenetetrahydrofolate dehydrogenase (NADP+)/methenyltetrahydrofolate cyclohydrolase
MRAWRTGNHLSAVILDGRKVAAEIKLELRQQVAKLSTKPGLGTVLVGEDPGSVSYVAGKHRDCAEVGMQSIRVDLPSAASESDVLAAIRDLNTSAEVTGYIVQLPLPRQMNTRKILESIDPAKDADGLHPFNLGKLVMNVSGEFDAPLPCTPAGIVELLRRYSVNLKGANVAVIGRGLTVGRPLGLLLSSKAVDATVTLLHSASEDIADQIKAADVVVAAVGIAGFVKADWIKPGAAVLDVGVSREGGQLQGDVEKAAMEVAGYFSPNPGGVGPMTRAMLMTNVVKLATKVF